MYRIIHFGKYYYPDRGGIESSTQILAQASVQAGHTVTVLCFSERPPVSPEILNGVRLLRCRPFAKYASQALSVRYLWRGIQEARKADIVHVHMPNMVAALASLFVPRRVKVLLHWHSDVISKGWLGAVMQPLLSFALKRADLVAVTSPLYVDGSPLLSRFKHKVTITPSGSPAVDLDSLPHLRKTPLPDDLEAAIAGRRMILAVGRLVPYKGFDTLVRSAPTLTENAVVVIVGSGPQEVALHRLIDELHVKNKVILCGRQSDAALRSLFARATLFCLPSIERSEAFGLVMTEAMAYKLPIVATNIPGSGVPWVNLHEVSGINVPPRDANSLSDACNHILTLPELHAKYSDGAYARFLEEFSEEISAQKMLAVYDQLASQSNIL